MPKISYLALFIAGLILFGFGLKANDSVASSVTEAVAGTPTDHTLLLLTLGVLGVISGGAGLMFGRRNS